MTSPRTLLGPLTTTWERPYICSYAMALCSTCNTGWQAQTCSGARNAYDFTDCWPPRASSITIDPGVMMGWGFYSPGIACPSGYTTAATAVEGGSTGWGLEYSLESGETAAACCPTGYTCSSIEVSDTYAQTCVVTATSTSFSTVQCDEGTFVSFSGVTVPNSGRSMYTLFAPLIQINFQQSDLPATSTSEPQGTPTGDTTATTATTAPGSTLTQIPTETGSSTTTSPSAGSSQNDGLPNAAKAGIGVGVGVCVLILIIVPIVLYKNRKRQRQAREISATEDGNDREKSPSKRHEIGGGEINELEGTVPQEVPATALSLGSPRQPGAIFELEGTTGPEKEDDIE
ncbi:hypothetical protein F4810DRAFT_68931 [Camillea tinctor]|nr:hypothetical protein F4810DRAFT_68931 [Camillea tinctor]